MAIALPGFSQAIVVDTSGTRFPKSLQIKAEKVWEVSDDYYVSKDTTSYTLFVSQYYDDMKFGTIRIDYTDSDTAMMTYLDEVLAGNIRQRYLRDSAFLSQVDAVIDSIEANN